MWLGRTSDSHLVHKCPGVELGQRRELRLATKPAEPPVCRAVGTPGDAVAVPVGRVGERQDFCIRDGLQ